MNMTKSLLAVMTMAFALTACGEKKADAPAASGAVTESTANLAPECQAYFERMEKCFAKGGAGIEAVKAGLEESKKGLLELPADQQAQACKMGNDQFAQVAQTAKCE
ncbi:DUF5339 domain-containing protein [Neisseria sp. 83E34]|uniref:DUF5339 domain-containing protein n=1 Tax=Neisseria sp. 83E34 TaxID=1692264 RepID=UPI0006CE6EB7|nr:DUF5339 domain-containing protein [Neisseria sp. 83E34]